MKKIRILSFVICISMLCVVLTGCMGIVIDTVVDRDGSGSCSIQVGYTKEGLELMNLLTEDEEAKVDINTLTPFVYNDITYYGEIASFEFTSCADFNSKLAENMSGSSPAPMDTGNSILTQLDDGSFKLVFGGEIAPPSSEDAMDEEMLKDAVMVLDFKFPYNVVQISEDKVDGVVVNGKTVSLELQQITKYYQKQGESQCCLEFIAKKDGGFSVDEESDAESSSFFVDVKETDWFYPAVKKMADIGLVTGVGNGKFNPDGEMTYAEFSQVVARANKAETGATDGYWAGKAVDYCRNHTYIKDLGAIIPANYDVPVPREVAVAGAYRMSSQFIKTKDASITEKNIPDYYAIDEAYRNEILLSYQSGLSRGADDKGTFNPKDTLTRAELCQLLYNAGFTVK
ncbi:MAG: S-layer homology domain-containing protein [Clostridia bacterium]|nr:S-layer homology domain-containing protein [Clostridia bacterium]